MTISQFKIWLMISLSFCLLQPLWADTCPSIASIQQHTLHGWQIYDAEEGTRLPPSRFLKFQQDAKDFALAEWKTAHHTMRCYYKDANGSNLAAYLAKTHFTPKNLNPYWYQVSGALQCAASMTQCQFHPLPTKRETLAAR